MERFQEVGLAENAPDERVWQFCQDFGYYALTGNRSATDEEASLKYVMQRLVTLDSLPVLTIGDLDRVLKDADYCERCAETIGIILLEPERYKGTPRLFIPFPTL